MCGMLYPAMEKTGVFPEYALHMTEIGEQTGRLDETMEALAAYYQREEEILDAVKSAVTYPVAMLGMLLVIVAVLFIKVMPVFEQVYMQLGARDDRSCTSVIEYWRLDEAVSNCSGSFGGGDLDHSIFRYFFIKRQELNLSRRYKPSDL